MELLPNTKLAKNISQQIIAGNISGDGAQMKHCLTDIHRDEVAAHLGDYSFFGFF
jgi:hypothetical protein